jgi:hypothetical protein
MAIWKDNTAPRLSPTPVTPAHPPEARETPRYDPPAKPELASSPAVAPPVPRSEPSGPRKESLIAADITIEGKIEGGGSVRIAGKFKGDVSVQGDLTIEAGAKLTGGVRANRVTIAGGARRQRRAGHARRFAAVGSGARRLEDRLVDGRGRGEDARPGRVRLGRQQGL